MSGSYNYHSNDRNLHLHTAPAIQSSAYQEQLTTIMFMVFMDKSK
jgi:hypothetical protein